ncbi:MAG: T9SS type A sorting domain-containing protein [Bacteroidales bacterium]|nr:T9SS type A sorting domain-containing protein [Bacteroidales bacterium]
MKTKIFMTLLLIAGLMPAVAQNYYPDTVDYPYEKYYYYFDRDKWLDGDTFVYHGAWVRTGRDYDSTTGLYSTVIMKWDTLLFHVHHELRVEPFLYMAPEIVYYNYTPRPIKVVGMATNIKPVYLCRPGLQVSPNLPDSTEYLLFYDARPDTFVCRQRNAFYFNDSVRLVRLHCRDTSNYFHQCCKDTTEYYVTEPFFESYFERPFLVKDSFYLGGTCYSADGFYTSGAYLHLDTSSSASAPMFWSDHAGLQWFDDEVYIYQLKLDTCPEITSLAKARYTRQPLQSEDPNRFIPYQWTYHIQHGQTPHVYPIYEEMCPVVEGVHVEHSQSDEVTVTWNAHGSHTTWMVTYGPLGMPRDSFAVVACLQPSITVTGLDSTRIYDISVQAQCDYNASDYEFYDADVFGNHDTTFVSEQGKHLYLRGGNLVSINDVTPDDGITLRPNPADRQVTVSATMPIKHVEVYDLAGRLVEARQPSGNTLQLDLKSYPSGTYLVKITTATGTTTKKLVVK